MDTRSVDQLFTDTFSRTEWTVLPEVARKPSAVIQQVVLPLPSPSLPTEPRSAKAASLVPPKPSASPVRTWLARAWLTGAVLLSGLLLAGTLPAPSGARATPTIVPAEAAAEPPPAPLPPVVAPVGPLAKRIEDLRVGDRIRTPRPADLALRAGDPFSTGPTNRRIDEQEVTPEGWRTLELRVEQPDGSTTRIEMLRPQWWLEEVGVREGGMIELTLLELEIKAAAKVVRVRPCKGDSRQNRPGEQVVTATLVHDGAEVWDLTFDAGTTLLGVTARHPLFSQDRAEWIAAGELHVGERVLSTGGASILTSKALRPDRETVYNLEVHRTHAYYVSHSGLLAHNSPASGGRPLPPAEPNSPTSGPRGTQPPAAPNSPTSGPRGTLPPLKSNGSVAETPPVQQFLPGMEDTLPPPGSRPLKGGANPTVQGAAGRGSTLHSDKPGHLPDQLRQLYPETDFHFTKSGIPGQDVHVIGGKHPSEYPGSTWPKGVDYGDFKPDTKGGRQAFSHGEKHLWADPTHILPYDPTTGELK